MTKLILMFHVVCVFAANTQEPSSEPSIVDIIADAAVNNPDYGKDSSDR